MDASFVLFLSMLSRNRSSLLLVCATSIEADILCAHWGLPDAQTVATELSGKRDLGITLLKTGIGMTNAAWHLGRILQQAKPDFAIQFGIAGAFPGGPEILEVVEVIEDCYAELGADRPGSFLSLEHLGFEHFRHRGLAYFNSVSQPRPPTGLVRGCRGITVNTVSGTTETIHSRQQMWNPEVETMEVAPFFQGCIMEEVPFRAFRAISNVVEPRNRHGWRISEAAEKMQHFLMELVRKIQMEEISL
jgi:futalosine hydrolase